jgi:tRNA-modifying protein YgfZ
MKQNSNLYFDLSHFALLQVSGTDAYDFLQKQFSCDLGLLDSYGWLFSGWCLPNGRVVATFIVFGHDDSLFMILPGMMKVKVIKRLSLFVLRSDVKINDVSDDYALLGITGQEINPLLDKITPGNNVSDGGLIGTSCMTVLRLWNRVPRYILVCKMDVVTGVLNNICATCIEGDRVNWSLLDIEAGIPWLVNSTSECYLPQMLNLDQMQGLSYKKGCYPGQEVISRLHYRGQLKKRMYLGSGSAVIAPGPGDQIELGDTGAAVGDIIDAERHPDGSMRFLAVTESAQIGNTTLRLRDSIKTPIKLATINYPLSENS